MNKAELKAKIEALQAEYDAMPDEVVLSEMGFRSELIPVTITDARWMTRAEFEAEPVKSPFGFWVWYLTDGIGRVGWSDYCLEEREFVQHEDYLDKKRVTHVLRIHPPQPPEVKG